MKKHLYSMLAAATISGVIGANVQAEEIVVKKGDTLWEISQKYDVTVEDIKKWNGLSSDLIYPNDKLEVSPEKHYIVQCGDTLWDIAKTNGVSVQDLKTWNKLSSDLIKPGLNLVIYPTAAGNAGTPAPSAQPVKASSVQNKQSAVKSVVNPQAVQNNQTAAKPVVKSQPVQNNQTAAKPVVKSQPVQNNQTAAKPVVKPQPVQNQQTTAKTATAKAPVANAAKEITVTATAYTASCDGCSGVTATGIDLKANPNAKVISVDPSVIPLGSKVYVEGYGYATAADTGGAIKGNVIDVFIPSQEKAVQWGRKQVKVTILK
ncbi:peptidoglycan-binding protein [Bacillus methanolicus]|uniref:LysM peptidoglycan-binding and 3D domain-containing protein n=1 Tax=Bacillus methanolicus TaxID=1471 RepID=UPI002380184C|nr:LysM peptidoglycan-binding and 3D domain-containing protein [Bacillus methanolicus]MDE3838896.1 peptidoglycan-binding protein [Bacillus methanolicus]